MKLPAGSKQPTKKWGCVLSRRREWRLDIGLRDRAWDRVLNLTSALSIARTTGTEANRFAPPESLEDAEAISGAATQGQGVACRRVRDADQRPGVC